MIDGEISRGDAAPFHPDRRQGIANGHGHGRAGGGGEVEGADFSVDGGFQHHITAQRQRGFRPPYQGNARGAPAFEVGQHLEQLARFATIGEQQADVVGSYHAQIPVQGIEGIEVEGHQADGGKGGGDLAGHDAALAHAGDHQLGFAIRTAFQEGQGSFHLINAQTISRSSDGGRFLLQAAGEGRQGRWRRACADSGPWRCS